jgi:hypothetical protein
MDILETLSINNPTFTGTVTLPTPFIVGGVTVTATGTELNKLAGLTASTAELNRCTGVTSPIQTQLDAKAATADIADFATDAEVALKADAASPRFTGQASIGGYEPDEYAILDLNSTTLALIVPRMTGTQRSVINPSQGMIIYNTDAGQFEGVTSAGWKTFRMY